MAARLLTEFTPVQFHLEESEGGRLVAKGEFAFCDRPTANKRVYGRKLYEREILRLSKDLESRKVMGELDHPQDGRTSLRRISHLITGLRLEDDGRVVGTAEILDTADGRQLAALFKSNVKIGVSSRGFGSLVPNARGDDVVQEDFRLLTFDFVADPANATSYPEVYNESKVENMVEKKLNSQDSGTKVQEPSRVETVVTENSSNVISQLIESVARIEKAVFEQREVEQTALLEEGQQLVVNLTEALEKSQQELAQLKEDFSALAHKARVAGYNYYIERQLRGHPEVEVVRSWLGDVSRFKDRAEADQALSEAVARFDKLSRSAQKTLQRQEQQTQHIAEEKQLLVNKATQYEAALTKVTEANNLLMVQLYATQRLDMHPRKREIMEMIEAAAPSSKDAVDRIIENYQDKSSDPEQLSSVRARIRALTQGGRSVSALDEERGSGSTRQPSVSPVPGLSVEEFKKAAGL